MNKNTKDGPKRYLLPAIIVIGIETKDIHRENSSQINHDRAKEKDLSSVKKTRDNE